MQHLVSVIQPGQRQWREESNRFLSHLVPPRLAVGLLWELWTIGQDNVMGKCVIAFKVIITPRFHFECIFIAVRNKTGGKKTNSTTDISRMADMKSSTFITARLND